MLRLYEHVRIVSGKVFIELRTRDSNASANVDIVMMILLENRVLIAYYNALKHT